MSASNTSIQFTPALIELMKQQIAYAISDFKFAENTVPGTNFQASILGLQSVFQRLSGEPFSAPLNVGGTNG